MNYDKFNVLWMPVPGPMHTPCHIRVTPQGALSALDRDGYAHTATRFSGKMVRRPAHAIRYLQAGGVIPAGMVLDHLCGNRACCNPAHVEPVTQAVNVRRSKSTKLTALQVNEIRLLAASGVKQGKIAEQFGIHQSHVSGIASGRFWSDGKCPAWEGVKSRRAEARAAR